MNKMQNTRKYTTHYSSIYNSISIKEQTTFWIVTHLTKIILMIQYTHVRYLFLLKSNEN